MHFYILGPDCLLECVDSARIYLPESRENLAYEIFFPYFGQVYASFSYRLMFFGYFFFFQ